MQVRLVNDRRDFNRSLSRKGLDGSVQDLHEGLRLDQQKYDIVLMIISFCHFRTTSADKLLEGFKSAGRKVVIIEEVVKDRGMNRSLKRRVMNYLCHADYCERLDLYTHDEFVQILKRHGYQVTRHDERYSIGTFGI